jgi:hypothetical protein
MAKNERDLNGELGQFVVTNWTEDFDMDANGAVAVVADTLGTLIKVLAEKGIIAATVTE